MKVQDRTLEITTGTNAIIFTKEVSEAPIQLNSDILVTHRYVAVSDQDLEQERAIPDEFLVNKAYICEVILTNVSPKDVGFKVLYQIPQGSLPLRRSKYMKS